MLVRRGATRRVNACLPVLCVRAGTLLSALHMLYPEGDAACQAAVLELLTDAYDAGGVLADAIAEMARDFGPELRHSEIGRLLDVTAGA